MLRYAPLHRIKLTSVLFRYTVIIITIKLVVLKQLQTRHQASPPLAAFHRASCSTQFQGMCWEMHCCRLGSPGCLSSLYPCSCPSCWWAAFSGKCERGGLQRKGFVVTRERTQGSQLLPVSLAVSWFLCSSCMKWLLCLCLLPFSISPLCCLTGTATAPSMQIQFSISLTVSNCSLLHW